MWGMRQTNLKTLYFRDETVDDGDDDACCQQVTVRWPLDIQTELMTHLQMRSSSLSAPQLRNWSYNDSHPQNSDHHLSLWTYPNQNSAIVLKYDLKWTEQSANWNQSPDAVWCLLDRIHLPYLPPHADVLYIDVKTWMRLIFSCQPKGARGERGRSLLDELEASFFNVKRWEGRDE